MKICLATTYQQLSHLSKMHSTGETILVHNRQTNCWHRVCVWHLSFRGLSTQSLLVQYTPIAIGRLYMFHFPQDPTLRAQDRVFSAAELSQVSLARTNIGPSKSVIFPLSNSVSSTLIVPDPDQEWHFLSGKKSLLLSLTIFINILNIILFIDNMDNLMVTFLDQMDGYLKMILVFGKLSKLIIDISNELHS